MPTLVEPIYDVLRAQAQNLARIQTGVVLEGTTGTGESIILHGPSPNLIRLYDEPLRLVQSARLANWERIITLLPVATEPQDRSRMGQSSRITHRTDKAISYQIQFYVRLTDTEMQADRLNILADTPKREFNPLAEKMHKLLLDFHHVFSDNDLLATAECPGGLVNHQEYDLVWDDAAVYPEALCHAVVSAHLAAWG